MCRIVGFGFESGFDGFGLLGLGPVLQVLVCWVWIQCCWGLGCWDWGYRVGALVSAKIGWLPQLGVMDVFCGLCTKGGMWIGVCNFENLDFPTFLKKWWRLGCAQVGDYARIFHLWSKGRG